MFSRVREFGTMMSLMVRAGLIAPLRPDRYVRMIAAVRREENFQRHPFRAGVISGVMRGVNVDLSIWAIGSTKGLLRSASHCRSTNGMNLFHLSFSESALFRS